MSSFRWVATSLHSGRSHRTRTASGNKLAQDTENRIVARNRQEGSGHESFHLFRRPSNSSDLIPLRLLFSYSETWEVMSRLEDFVVTKSGVPESVSMLVGGIVSGCQGRSQSHTRSQVATASYVAEDSEASAARVPLQIHRITITTPEITIEEI